MRIQWLAPGDERQVDRAARLFDEPPDPTAVRAYLEDRRNVFLLACENELPVGFLRGTELRQLHSHRRQMFLYEIAVDEHHRRRGIGAGLVRELLRYCREREFEEVFVFTDPANAAAVGLYRSTGGITETPADRMFVYPLTGTPAKAIRSEPSDPR
jgi:ribosomal protein S18 acetylase RimI-like enzyme